MATYNELIYMVLDELKIDSDDSYFTEDHVMFLLTKYRSLLLKQRYSDARRIIPLVNYNTLCLTMIEHAPGDRLCGTEEYLRSIVELPYIMDLTGMRDFTKVTTCDIAGKTISFVNKERFRFVGNNKWTRNSIFATIADDGHLYLKSSNPQFRFLDKVSITSIFEDPVKVYELECDCNGTSPCSITNSEIKLQEDLIPQLIGLCVAELGQALYKPTDKVNDGTDELSTIGMRSNKSNRSNGERE